MIARRREIGLGEYLITFMEDYFVRIKLIVEKERMYMTQAVSPRVGAGSHTVEHPIRLSAETETPRGMKVGKRPGVCGNWYWLI